MNILLVHDDPEIQEEIREFLTLQTRNVFFSSNNTGEAIRTLNYQTIELVVMKINNMKDASILKYVNDNYTDLEVLILASKEYNEIISAFIHGHFTLMQQPVNLAELKKKIANLLEFRSVHS